ncbi:MAG: hypothetical protein K1X57_14345 [Gemmataceae bacterium]|nr:hypothetical protein [Gemmataceae bacterium]
MSPAPATPARRVVGMNLGGVVDWSAEWPFVEVFKTSRKWMENGPGPFTYDDRGRPLLRPGQMVETLIFRDLGGHYPAGDYVTTWSGGGTVEVRQFDVTEVISQRPGRIVSRVKPGDGGILVRVTASPASDPVRDLRVWVPGFENSKATFHPAYLERLKPFGVIRFMDWQRTNNSPLFTWSERPRLHDERWSTDLGVPLEVQIDLANAAGADPWFCVPHLADDDYIRQMGRLVKERLDANRKVYLEYSNEVWNWGFGQTSFAAARGKRLKLGAPDHHRFYVKRSVEVFDLFAKEFGRERLVRVLSGQFANPSDCEFILSTADAAKTADAFAVGAYFGYEFGSPKSLPSTLRMAPEEVLERCGKEIDGTYRELIRRHVAMARKYNLRLLAYEGGQHLVGHSGAENNEELMKLLIAANRHPKMADLYKRQLTHWFNEGGDVFAAFSFAGRPSKWGSWGSLEFQDQPLAEAHKYRALADFANGAGGR